MKKVLFAALLMSLSAMSLSAQEPLWQGKGRIAISSDGNEHDDDDWAATPMSLALLASQGLQDKLALYTYSDHVWGSNQAHPASDWKMCAYDQMKESALGGAREFGFDSSRFICAVDNAAVAYNAMRDQINRSSAENPLIIIGAGPMQVIGEALNRSEVDKRQFVTVVSHSGWNNFHADRHREYGWDIHTGWTFAEMQEAFEPESGGGVKFVQIKDQNKGKDYMGLNAPFAEYDWVRTSKARNNEAYRKGSWDWLYLRLLSCLKQHNTKIDPSDAGMIYFVLTGDYKTSPALLQEMMENPNEFTHNGK